MPKWLDEMTNAGEPVIPANLRNAVLERDEGQCVKCGTKDRKSTRLNSSHIQKSRMPSSA